MNVILIVIGFLVLVAGAQTYSMFAAGAAFLTTVEILPRYADQIGLQSDTQWELILSGLVSGVIILLLVHFLDRIPVYIASAAAGAYLVSALPIAAGYQTDWVTISMRIVTGSLFLALALISFDFGLILITTLSGSTLVVQYLPLAGIEPIAMLLVLTIFGLVAQFLLLQYAPTGKPE